MNKIKIEIKWAVLFSVMVLVWTVIEKISGLYGSIYTTIFT